MKRIALLLAGTLLGTGCVVETTCDPQTLTVDWRFIDANGNTDLGCGSTSIAATYGMDIWIDGFRADYDLDACDYTPVVYSGVGTGWHRVSVEGYSFAGDLINRDYADVYVDSCGDTAFPSSPGAAYLEINPTLCDAGTDNLLFSIWDETRSAPGTVFDEILSTDGAFITTYTCAGGIYWTTPTPYGDYVLAGLEEVNSSGSTRYASNCSDLSVALNFDTITSSPPETATYTPALDAVGNLSCGL